MRHRADDVLAVVEAETGRARGGEFLQFLRGLPRFVDVAEFQRRIAVGEIEHGAVDFARGRFRDFRDFLETAEAHQRQGQHRGVAVQSRQVTRRLQRRGAFAAHGARVIEHGQVVGGVSGDAEAMGRFLVRKPGLGVGAHRVMPQAHLVPGVARHVVDVA